MPNFDDIYGIFYDPRKVLSYGRPLIASVGSRSIGKSTGWGIHLLSEFVDHGKQWIYTRRDKDELLITCRNYFSGPRNELNKHGYEIGEVTYEGGTYYVDGKVAGYAIPLNLQEKYKSSNFEDVHYILYDEFIVAPHSNRNYIGGRGSMAEYDALMSLLQTVDRGSGKAFRDEVTTICVGNAGRYYNPIFLQIGADRYLRPDTKYLAPKGELWVVEQTRETDATKLIKQSNVYRLSSERYRDYSAENTYQDLDKSEFFDKPKGRRDAACNLHIDGVTYSVWVCEEDGLLYMDNKAAHDVQNYALTTNDHRPNYLLMRRYSGDALLMEIKAMYDMGLMRFSGQKTKMALDTWLKYDII